MKYEATESITRAEALKRLRSADPDDVCRALVGIVHSDADWRWLQEQCSSLARHESAQVRGLVATCFGHIARLCGQLDLEAARIVLRRLALDPEVAGRVDDALDDIQTYLGIRLDLA